MGIQHFDSQEAMDDEFEATMEAMQEEARLKELISETEHSLAETQEEVQRYEDELKDLNQQLENLGL